MLPGRLSRIASRNLLTGLAVLATLLGCAGCFLGTDRAFGSQTIGVHLLDGGPAVLLYSCPGRPVTTLTITKHNIHTVTDEVVWEIERTSAAGGAESVEDVPVGQAPAGYRTVVPLSTPLPPTPLDAVVTRRRLEGVVAFKVADLREDSLRVDASWFSQHHSVDRDRFLRVNRKNC